MKHYILENKAAWEEDILQRVTVETYAFFNPDMVTALKQYDLKHKTIGQFCCNNGRELLSLVKSANAGKGIGFDIATNQVQFANEKAAALNLPCEFVAITF